VSQDREIRVDYIQWT